MYTSLKALHSYMPYLFFAIGAVFFVQFTLGLIQKKEYKATDKRTALIVLALAHLQLIIGLVLYFISPITTSAMADFGAAMKDASVRLYAVEHISVNIIGIIAITIGYSKAKRMTESKFKFKTTLLFYAIGYALILSRIPWNAWLG